ncbi:hypothetical protein ABZ424_27585 [Streptomyces sp. NPDC005790]|uniref:hypothetical protein n=1 Tax=Streptomyces sp. NPDC005790 TaxID=3154777 RepID=UPI0033E9E385
MDEKLSDDLAVMMSAGMTVSDAVRTAVSIVAGTYRNAWDMGVVPEGVEPIILGCSVLPERTRPTRPTPRPTGPDQR